MPILIQKKDTNGKPLYWVDKATGKRWAGRAKHKGKWYIYGSDGTKTLIGDNKYNFKDITTTDNRPYNPKNLNTITQRLENYPIKQRATIIGNIIEESGGNPLAKSKNETYQGLLQWGKDRYVIQSDNEQKELNNQINYLQQSINNTTDKKSWTDGGTGSGYMSLREAYDDFTNENLPLSKVHRAFSFGYVRPLGKEDSYRNRLKVVQQVYPRIILAKDSIESGLLPEYIMSNKLGGTIKKRFGN